MCLKKLCCKLCMLLSLVSFGALGGNAEAAYVQRAVSIPENYAAQEVKTKFAADGPTLLFSDSPEMVYHSGILYRDTVQGKVRIFFHHVNAVAGQKKLAIMLKNEKIRPVHYKILRSGIDGLSYSYMKDGKKSQQKYFAGQQNISAGSLNFDSSVELLSGKGVLLAQDRLLTGTIDLELDRPTQISVLMCEPQTDLALFNENAAIQPMDEHPLRGTFLGSDWHYTVKQPITGDKPVKLKLASGEEGFAKGVDATTGLAAENYGNYGVVYKVEFKIDSEKPLSFIFNPIGGYFAGYGILESGGRRQLVSIPDYDVSLGGTIEEAVELAKLKAGRYSFIWSPPGASNLPVELLWR